MEGGFFSEDGIILTEFYREGYFMWEELYTEEFHIRVWDFSWRVSRIY